MPPAAYSEDAEGHPGRGLGTGPDGTAQQLPADILHYSTSPVGGVVVSTLESGHG